MTDEMEIRKNKRPKSQLNIQIREEYIQLKLIYLTTILQ